MADVDAMYRNRASDPEVTKQMRRPAHKDHFVTERVVGSWIPNMQILPFISGQSYPKTTVLLPCVLSWRTWGNLPASVPCHSVRGALSAITKPVDKKTLHILLTSTLVIAILVLTSILDKEVM